MLSIVTKLPKEIELSPDIKERTEGYIEIRRFGLLYYVPITKEMKKEFGIKRIGKKFIFKSWKSEHRIEKLLRDIISGVYLQIRDSVGAMIHQQISQELSEGFEKLFEKTIEGKINAKFQKLLPYKKQSK